MALAAFDTLEFVETLKEAGVPEKQAKAFSTAVRKSHESLEVATKPDLDKLGMELRHEMDGLRHEISDLRKDMDAKHESLRKDMDAKFVVIDARFAGMDAKLEKAKSDLLRWIVGLAIGHFVFLAGIFWKIISMPGVH